MASQPLGIDLPFLVFFVPLCSVMLSVSWATYEGRGLLFADTHWVRSIGCWTNIKVFVC